MKLRIVVPSVLRHPFQLRQQIEAHFACREGSQSTQRFYQAWIAPGDAFEQLDRPGEVADLRTAPAHSDLGLDHAGIDRQGSTIGVAGDLVLALLSTDITQREKHAGLARFDGDRLLDGLRRHFHGAQAQVNSGQCGKGCPAQRVQHHGAHQIAQCIAVPLLVRENESKRVQRRHVVRVGSQERFTDGLGLIEPPVQAVRLGLLHAKEAVLKYIRGGCLCLRSERRFDFEFRHRSIRSGAERLDPPVVEDRWLCIRSSWSPATSGHSRSDPGF